VSVQSFNERKRQRKAKLGGYRYVSSFKPSYGYKEEHKGYESEKESSEHNGYYRHDRHERHDNNKKRHK